MTHNLIPLTDWPSMPAPMQSEDEGEAWVWNEFVISFQKNPMNIMQGMQAMTGNKNISPAGIEYPYAMTVFYNKFKNPHGPSSRPILTVAIEQANFAAAAALLGSSSPELKGAKGPMMLGKFTADGRFNLGDYRERLSTDSARQTLFNLIKNHLDLQGEPVRIGIISDIHGHPNTGWPRQDKPAPVSKSGCLVIALAIAPAAYFISKIL